MTIPDILGYSQIFPVSKGMSFERFVISKKGPFDSTRLLEGPPKKPKDPFFLQNKTYNKSGIPSIATGKSQFSPRAYPGRLVTLSKRWSRARCAPKKEPGQLL